MACPHLNISMVKRSAGDSAVAAAAYQSRSDIFNEYRQQTERYARKRAREDDVVHLEVMLPDHAPKAYKDRGVLWNSVELVEDQRNAQLARRIILTLPNEVPRDEWAEMVRQYCQEQFVSKGMCADVAIHYTEPPPNPHAHILLTLRSIDEHGKWCPKFRKVPCDDGHGNPILDEKGKPKMRPVSTNGWNDKGNAELWRAAWAAKQNEFLDRCGSKTRVDLRSYERQGVLQVPTVHLGKDASALVRKGEYSYLHHLNQDIKETNGHLSTLQKAAKAIIDWFTGWMERREDMMEQEEIRRHPPIVGDLYSWWLLRREQRSDWSSERAQAKCGVKDWGTVHEMIDYCQDHGIHTAESLMSELECMEEEAAAIWNRLAQLDRRLRDIPEIIRAADTVKRLQPVKDKTRYGFKTQTQSYAAAHADELAEYNKAYRTLMKLNGDSHVDADALSREAAELNRTKARFIEMQEDAKPRLTMMRKVRKCVQAVWADADLDDKRIEHASFARTNHEQESIENRNKPKHKEWDMAI